MYNTKGFVPHSKFQNNAVGVVSPIGEISTNSMSFAREKGQYVADAAPNLTYWSFLSNDDGATVPVPVTLTEHILAVAKHVYDNTLTSAGEIFADELLVDLLATFASTAEGFACGAIVTDGTYYVPEWLSWKSKGLSGVDAQNSIRIWFADGSFQLQYDEFEIVVVPPINNLNDFFKTGQMVDDLLTSITPVQQTDRLQAARSGFPETVIRTLEYTYIDPNNPAHTVPSYWSVLVYGAAGNNVDSISDALVAYALAHSTHTRAEWVTILPDLFKRTEVIIVPRWDKLAIPDRQLTQGVYSPVVNMTAGINELVAFVTGYPEAHIKTFGQTYGNPYKSLSLFSIGGPDNRNNQYRITDMYPDYINVPSLSADFDRMSVKTKAWADMLSQLLIFAETATEFGAVAPGITKAKRDGKLYVVRNLDNVNYLVATKSNFAT